MLLYAIAALLAAGVQSTILEYTEDMYTSVTKRALQKAHEKPRIQKLSEFFLETDFYLTDPDQSLIDLLKVIASQYLSDCTTVILYDNYTETYERVFLTKFFRHYPLAYVHGSIPEDYRIQIGDLVNKNDKTCVHFIIFVKDVMRCQDVINKRHEKVVVVAKSSQWRVQEYLSSEFSQEIANLLVIVKSDKFIQQKGETPFIIYTHKLFVDALGSSQPIVIASWSGGNFSSNVSLFQTKLTHGFSGHRFIVATAHQPPYVIKMQTNDKDEFEYSGIEVKLVELLAKMYNFSTDYKESADIRTLGSGEAVLKAMQSGTINLGIGGLYVTENRYNSGIFHWHSEDCASFISLASTALPRYRAIMGPFRWTVWLGLIGVYLGAIFLFTYSDKLTLKHLIRNPIEIENMFWYVFGTFTNCFTFSEGTSWTRAERDITKLLVGIYWLFTIIITACYTGSIIAFVTLPVYPAVIDSIDQLAGKRYQIGMLNKGGWPSWFQNVSDEISEQLLKRVDYVPDVESGLKNVTKAFFWPYALLGSREELQFIVKTNFSIGSKKSLLHISEQCFVPFKVGIVLPHHLVYSEILAVGIQMILQSGLHIKIKNDVEWETLRSSTGRLLAANSKSGTLTTLSREDRALTLDDTQGMFLLLAIGFVAGGGVLITEIFGGCLNLCKKFDNSRAGSSNSSIPSNPRFHERQTIRERHRSISLASLQQRHNSIQSDIIFEKTHVEEPLQSGLVECDIHEMPDKRSKVVLEETDSDIDYNEEISKLFGQALENESSDSSSQLPK